MNWTNPQGVLRTYWGESECQAIASEAAAPGVHAATDSVRTASRNACTPSEGRRTRLEERRFEADAREAIESLQRPAKTTSDMVFPREDCRADSTTARGSDRV